MYYTDKNVKDLFRVFDQNERKDYLRLDLNENPGGLPQPFISQVLAGVDSNFLSQYPETLRFTTILADYLKTDIKHICLVNGSAEGIRYIIEAFTSPGGKVVGVVPSYFMFQVYSEMYGRLFVKIPYDEDLKMDVDRIISSLTVDTQLLILVNPNNPVGNVYTEEEFEKIVKVANEKEITILVDEAYFYFYPKSFIDYALKREHIFVTRTFSKLFSLAGCRLGYVVGWPSGIEMVQKLCTPHNTNAFAMLFAEKIIQDPKMIEFLIEEYNDGRDYLVKTLTKNNYIFKGEAGNFLFIKPKKLEARSIVDIMKKDYRILIKAYQNIGSLGDCLRVSIGAKQYMEKFIDALLRIEE